MAKLMDQMVSSCTALCRRLVALDDLDTHRWNKCCIKSCTAHLPGS